MKNIKVFACGEVPNSIIKSKVISTNQLEKYVQVNNHSFSKYYIKSFLKEDENFVKYITLYDKHEKNNLEEVKKVLGLGNLDAVIILGNLKDKHCLSNMEVISKTAKEKGALVIAMVLIPYAVDEKGQFKYDAGVQALANKVDTVIPLLAEELAINSNMPLVTEDGIYFPESYMLLCTEQLMDFFEMDGLVSLDKEDIEKIFKDSGLGHISVGYGEGEEKIKKALDIVFSSNKKLIECNKFLIGISSGIGMDLMCIHNALEKVQATVSPNCDIVFATSIDDELKDNLVITIVGIKKDA